MNKEHPTSLAEIDASQFPDVLSVEDIAGAEIRDVVGLENRFFVTSTGLIISKPSKTSKGVVRKPEVSNSGYKRVTYQLGATTKKFSVHRAVAEAFISNPDDKPCVNHIDNNRLNNNVENLEWATYKENTGHGVRQGRWLNKRWDKAKLNAIEVQEIKDLSLNGMRPTDIARKFGISYASVHGILSGKNYKYPERLRQK